MDFLQLGQYLRETRENSERTLDEASQELRIRLSHLEAFERGDFGALLDVAPMRGFLRNYAKWLGLDDDRIIAYYEEASVPDKKRGRKKRRKTQEVAIVAPRSITDTPRAMPPIALAEQRAQRGRRLLWGLFVVIASVASLVIIAFVTVEIVRFPQEEVAVQPTPQTGLAILPPTATFTPSWTPRPAEATPTPTSAFIGRGVLVEITLTQRSYLRVVVDGGEQFAGVARPGEALRYEGLNSVTLTAGNADALEIVYNGREQPNLGVRGQRVEVVFTPDGVDIARGPGVEPTPISSPTAQPSPVSVASTAILAFTPTEGPSPTATDTPTATVTPVPTDTPMFTPTPIVVATETPEPVVMAEPTATPSMTASPTTTGIPTATAVLPMRVTPEGLPPTKAGG